MSFELHPRLAAGGFHIGRIAGSHLLLKNNALYPWFILVPETDMEDLHQLPATQYAQVCEAIHLISTFISLHFKPEKLNVGCIGNQVRQMHIHLVGRSLDDPAWPGTVWASDEKRPYTDNEVAAIRSAALANLPLS